MEIYIVQQNDTIYDIAEKFGVSVQKLIQDNEIETPSDLVPGQTIVITYPEQIYTVREGDTLESIAKDFNVSIMQLLRNNPFLSISNIYPGETIVISYNTTGEVTTNGFVYPFVDTFTLKKTLPNLTYISIYNYKATGSGEIISYMDESEIIQISKEFGTIPLLLATTVSPQGEADIEAAYNILLNNEFQDLIINSMLNIIKTKGYYGVNIVFSYLNTTNYILYQNFITKVSNRLGNEGYLVFVTIDLNIKYDNNEISFEKIDYSGISQVVNGILFLEFFWGTSYDPPSPVSSIDRIRAIINYAINSVPADKVVAGIPLISYDWGLPFIPGRSYANSLSINASLSLARDSGAMIQFDDVSQTPFFIYTQIRNGLSEQHIVWSIDARSILALAELIFEFGLNGAGLWNVMIYLPQLWLVLNTQFDILKLLPNNLNTTNLLP